MEALSSWAVSVCACMYVCVYVSGILLSTERFVTYVQHCVFSSKKPKMHYAYSAEEFRSLRV